MFFLGAGLQGWGGSIILVWHNLSIIPPVEHNFEHNTLVSWVTPESIFLYFSSVIRQNLISSKKSRRRKKSRQEKQKVPVLASAVRCRMTSIQLSSLLAEALISGLLPGGGIWRKKTILPNRFPCANTVHTVLNAMVPSAKQLHPQRYPGPS